MMDRKIIALTIIAMMLNLFDVWSTLFILDRGGIELNPIMAYIIEISPWFFIFIKIFLFGLAVILMAKYSPRHLKWVVVFYGLLAIWHCYLHVKIHLYFIQSNRL